MRLHIGSVLALLAHSHYTEAAWPQRYRRHDQGESNGTYVPQVLPSASPTNYNVTSVTLTYAFVPETHSETVTSLPTVSVISSLVVISTYTKTTSIELLPTVDLPSTDSAAASSTATRLPYPVSGRPSQSFVVPGNGSYPTAAALSASQTSQTTKALPRPKAWRPKPENGSCGGATLNVVNAHLDYWYTETYTHTVSTLSVQFNANESQTGWTILPATTEFDISSAITQETCGASSTTVDTVHNVTFTATRWGCYTTPTPVASSTTLLSVDAFTPTNQTTGNGTQIPNIATEPPLAVVTLPSAAGTYTEGTPFIYFSEYEIESSRPTTLPNGSAACAVDTRMFLLNKLFSFAFNVDEAELSQESLASQDTTGEIDPEFLRLVGETESVTAGTWAAEPTVIVVVERGVVAQAVLAGYTQVEGGPLITPTPTLPDFLSSIDPTSPAAPATYYSPRVEQTADSLEGPTYKPSIIGRLKTFVAHVEQKETTLILPTPTDATVITTKINGMSVTATALSNIAQDGGDGGNSNGGQSNSNPGNSNSGNSNSGNSNSGNSNSGNSNSGNSNSGNSNSGDSNSGDSNSGDSNSGDSNTGNSNDGKGSGTNNDNENGNGAGSGSGNSNGGTASAQGNTNQGSGSGSNTDNNAESEGDWVVRPFFAHVEKSEITINVPAPATQKVATVAFEGMTLTATALNAIETGADGSRNGGSSNYGSNNGGSSNGGGGSDGGGWQNGGGIGSNGQNGQSEGSDANSDQNGGGGVFGDLVSVIANAAKPTNALQVLSQAMDQDHSDATAAAIAAGVGGLAGIAAGDDSRNGGSNGASDNSQGGSVSHSGSDSGSGSGLNDGASGGSNAQPEHLGASPGQVFTVGSATFTATSVHAFVIDGQTAVPGGGAPITVDGTVISLPASTNAIVIDGSTRPLAGDFASSTAFDIGGMKITVQPGVGFPIAGQTLQAGGPAINVDGTRLSLAPGGTAVVIGSSTSAIAAPAGAASEIPELTIGPQTFTANAATQFFLAPGQTLTPGGTAVFSGTTVSLDSKASAVVVNGQTRTFGSSPDAAITSPPEIIRVNGQAFAPNAGSSYLVFGQTLTPGGSITVAGPNGAETLSLASSGTKLVAVVSGHTFTSTLDAAAAADATSAPILTIGGQTFTSLPGTNGANPAYLINGEFLAPGGEETVTVGGKTYVVSLSPKATLLEIEELGSNGKATTTSVQTLFPATVTGRTSTMTGHGSRTSSQIDSEQGTGVGTASPAQATGAANSSAGTVQLATFFVTAGTFLLAVLL